MNIIVCIYKCHEYVWVNGRTKVKANVIFCRTLVTGKMVKDFHSERCWATQLKHSTPHGHVDQCL